MTIYSRAARFAAALSVALLAACGGGGDGSSSTPAAVVQPAQVQAHTSAPQLSVPASTLTGEPLAAFAHLNALRQQAGLGLLAQDPKLDVAAQAHANYLAVNNAWSHYETAGLPGFTGVDPAARIVAAGVQASDLNETFSGVIDNTGGPGVIDALMAVIYHRGVLLGGYKHVGIATWAASVNTNLVADYTVAIGDLPQASNSGVGYVIWPLNGATNVPRRHGKEAPDPLADLGGYCNPYCPGYAASIHIDIPSGANMSITAASFAMVDATGATIAVKQVDYLAGSQMYGIVPLAPLAANATYTVTFSGTAGGKSIVKTWSFTTGAN